MAFGESVFGFLFLACPLLGFCLCFESWGWVLVSFFAKGFFELCGWAVGFVVVLGFGVFSRGSIGGLIGRNAAGYCCAW